jgi:putative membrane protein
MPDQARKRTFDSSTRLSFERTRLSYERTMMSWIRTATSLITFGFGIYKFFELELERGANPSRLVGPREFSMLMVGTGLLSLLLGTLEHWRNMRLIRAEYPEMPRSLTSVVAAFILALGILAFISVIFRQ